MAKLEMECKVLAGAESKAFLADLTKIVERMERAAGVAGGKSSKVAAAAEEEEAPAETEEEEEDFAPKAKKAAAKPTASFEEEDEEPAAEEPAESEEEEEEADFTTPPAKKAKAKKFTVNDVNAACKKRATKTGGEKGRDEVLAILTKNFKTKSVSDLTPEQFQQCIKLMEA